jgi:hypothetical protein
MRSASVFAADFENHGPALVSDLDSARNRDCYAPGIRLGEREFRDGGGNGGSLDRASRHGEGQGLGDFICTGRRRRSGIYRPGPHQRGQHPEQR